VNDSSSTIDRSIEDTEHSLTECFSVCDEFLDGYDQQLIVDSDLETRLTCDSLKIIPTQSDGEHAPAIEDEIHSIVEDSAKNIHQAYIVDEVDEELQSMPSEIAVNEIGAPLFVGTHEQSSVTTEEEETLELEVTRRVSELLSDHDDRDDKKEDEVDSRQDESLCTIEDDVPDGPEVEDLERKDLVKAGTLKKAKHNNKPKGVIHRLVFSRSALRNRLVTVKGTSAAPRLASTRRHKG
jgi:hypothetical protein